MSGTDVHVALKCDLFKGPCESSCSALEAGDSPPAPAGRMSAVVEGFPLLNLNNDEESLDLVCGNSSSEGASAPPSCRVALTLEKEPEGGTGYRFDSVEDWVCAICREKIAVEETAQIKGCDHSYCVTCILRWASYKPEPWCPQCRLPFTFVYVYKSIDGSLHDYLYMESICLLLRAPWFKGVPWVEIEEPEEYHDEDDGFEEYYYRSNVRIGNRRWGDNGYVRGGRREARPVSVRQVSPINLDECEGSMSSSRAKGKGPVIENAGRRAKRAQKRQAAEKAAAAKSGQSGGV